jgi:two-component system, chemotaxis family, chemotaxis protein CheY
MLALDVLIVDDHEPMRAMLRKVLERAGVNAIRDAASGQAALALLQERGAHLILVDQTMPEMDGLALVERVRADPNCASVRIVMLTGRADAAHAEAAREAGVDAVLVKPIAPRELLDAIERVLGA